MSNTNPNALNDAIAAARAGRREDAARMLRNLVTSDPFNADAWVWLAGVTSDFREQRTALERALTIAPDNQRARQGLNWLQQAHPEVFDGGSGDQSGTRPRSARTTPSYEQRAAPQSYQTVVLPQNTEQSGARTYETVVPSDQPSDARAYETIVPAAPRRDEPITPSARNFEATQPLETPFAPPRTTFDAPTQPLPVQSGAPHFVQPPSAPEPFFAPPQQTDRMPVHNAAPPNAYQPLPTIDAGRTDRMAAAPPPPATPAVERGAVARRDNRGNLSRWLLVLLWALGLGASATMAALFILDPNNFAPFVRTYIDPLLGGRFQFDLGSTALTAFITTIALIALAVIDLIVLIGLIMRGRWAWVINLLFALLVTAGTVGLAVLVFSAVNTADLLNPAFAPLLGLIIFTLIYLIWSFTSRRAFFRRRVEHHGR